MKKSLRKWTMLHGSCFVVYHMYTDSQGFKSLCMQNEVEIFGVVTEIPC